MSKVVERFLNYVKYDTRSDSTSNTTPSSSNQLVLARYIAEELNNIGLQEVSLDDKGYIMATLPSNLNRKVPTIGFIAHMDTSPEMPGKDIKPNVVENYIGEDILLNKELNLFLSPKDFPELKDYIGKTLITTDGTTLLGADDKAGIAEIITAMEYLISHPEVPHGTVKIGFTPDEEVGRGADHFDVKKFGADFAYTLDGGPIGELEYENFNAAGANVTVHGVNIHPGSAKNRMKNSMLIASEFIGTLPSNETPATTEGYEGFYHLVSVEGDVEKTTLHYIIRDFGRETFEARKGFIKKVAQDLNKKYGEGTVDIEVKDSYFNMREKIEEAKYVVDIAFDAMRAVDIEPIIKPIRGGTDGARLSFMGLPTPNIFAGGHNFHGRYEFVPTFAMEKAVDVVLKIVEIVSNK